MNYENQCNKYFQPLDLISEAIVNREGIAGVSSLELINIVAINEDLSADLIKYEGCDISNYI